MLKQKKHSLFGLWSSLLLKSSVCFLEKNAYSLLERVKNRVYKAKILGTTTE